MAQELDPTLLLIAYLGSFGAAVASATAFILNAFKKNRDVFYKGIEKLDRKLSRHFADDNRRFDIIDDRLWDLQLRNSRKDGTPRPRRQSVNSMIPPLEEDANGEEGSDNGS